MSKNKNMLLLMLLSLIVLPGISFTQTLRNISGTVVDDKGFPMLGVSIYEKEFSGNGALTDEKGSFHIQLKGTKDVLVFSFVNYLTQEIVVTDSSNPILVTLPPDQKGMDEVVVLGYGQKIKKITLTGSVSSINGTVLRQSPTASLQNALVGRLPGLFSMQRGGQPGKDAALIQIRGLATFTGTANTYPLIIVDDIEFNIDQLSQIDPNEVESISILKDASVTAVYGVRGANGVIVLTTRRGKSGKPQLTLRNETGFNFPTQRPKLNDGYTTLRLFREYLAAGLGSGNFIDPATSPTGKLGGTIPAFQGNNLQHYLLNDDPDNFPNVDWWDALMRKYSLQNRVNFDISGGTQKVKYFVSLGYLTQDGIFKNFSTDLKTGYNGNYFYNRYNFRSNLDLDPTKSLHIRMDISGRFGVTNEPNDKGWNNGGSTFQYLWSGEISSFIYPIYYSNGLLASVVPNGTKPNPVANLAYSGYNRTFNNDMTYVIQAAQKLDAVTPGLAANILVSYASNYGFQKSLTRVTNVSSTQILVWMKDANGNYVPAVPNMYRMGPLSRGGGATGTNRLLNVQASLNYSKQLGNHEISAIGILNQTVRIDDVYGTSAAALADGEPVKNRGIVAVVNYNYKHKYLLDVNGAYNGSDKFIAAKRYGLFPVVSAGWNISEENFFKNNISFINSMKLRGSFGYTGNDNIGSVIYNYDKAYVLGSGKSYSFGQNPTSISGMVEPTLANHDITWENQKEWNIGADLGLFNNRLTLTADVFNRYRYDILAARGTVYSAFGAALPLVNLGKVRNKGFELDLKYNQRVNETFSYFVDAQVTRATSQIIFLDEPTTRFPWLARTGQPVGAQFGYTAIGFYQDIADVFNSPRMTSSIPLVSAFPGGLKFKDLDGDGMINQYDQGYLGTVQPTYVAGLSFGLSFRGIDISTLFQGAFGNLIPFAQGSLAYSRPDRVSVNYNLGRWTPGNAENAVFPALGGGTSISAGTPNSSYWYSKGDYIRWKNVEIGYRMPSTLIKKVGLSNARIYINGYNLGLLYTAMPVFVDPETQGATSQYPQQRIINLGIQVGL